MGNPASHVARSYNGNPDRISPAFYPDEFLKRHYCFLPDAADKRFGV
jgi:hypothetical protein